MQERSNRATGELEYGDGWYSQTDACVVPNSELHSDISYADKQADAWFGK